MAKITVKAVTRLQKFLAAIAGDGVAPDPITDKEKLLHNIAENVNNGGGSGGGVLVVTDTNGTLDKTWQEIYSAAENKIPTALRVIEEDNIVFNWISSVFKESEDSFYVDFGVEGSTFNEYSSDSANGYPASEV